MSNSLPLRAMKKSSGGGGGFKERPNTLRSVANARLIDLVSEGPIVGLVDGARSVFLDETQLQSSGGTFNFSGVRYIERFGLPDQPPIPGQTEAESIITVGAKVTKTDPVVRAVNSVNIDAARVTIRIPQLSEANAEKGDLRKTTLEFSIEWRPTGGAWRSAVYEKFNDKTTSPFERDYLINFTEPGPWEVRVTRITADSTSVSLNNELYFQAITELTYGRFIYPDSALVGIEVDMERLGTGIPERAYQLRGIIVSVPSNYNPISRTYATTGVGTSGGIWDGSFKQSWTNNPVWLLLALLLNQRWGAELSIDQIDLASFYEVAAYCDQLVPDGFGGTEPRYTFNYVLDESREIHQWAQILASSFRGMIFWASNLVTVRADKPSDPILSVTPANVIDGRFVYSSTGLRARHTVAHVAYNDPGDFYRPSIEVVQNFEGIDKVGYRETSITLEGCTSRGMAARHGRWALDTEWHGSTLVTYRAAWDHAAIFPGDVVAVHDPSIAGVRFGGRLQAGSTANRLRLDGDSEQTLSLDDGTFLALDGTELTLENGEVLTLPNGEVLSLNGLTDDSALSLQGSVTLEPGQAYHITVTSRDNRVYRARVLNEQGSYDTLDISGLPFAPEPGDVWLLEASNLAPQLFRVVVNRMLEQGIFEITALLYDPTKYARVEQGIRLEKPPISKIDINTRPRQPENLAVNKSDYRVNNQTRTKLTVSWSPPNDTQISGYDLIWQGPGHAWTTPSPVPGVSFEIPDAEQGVYEFKVRSVALDGRVSDWAHVVFENVGKEAPPPQPTQFLVVPRYRGILASWINPTVSDFSHVELWSSETSIFTAGRELQRSIANSFLDTLEPDQTRYYWLRSVDDTGNKSPWLGPISATSGGSGDMVDTTPPAAPTELAATAATRMIALSWKQPVASDLDFIEVHSSLSNDSATAVYIGKVSADAFVHAGLPTGVTRYYWLKAVDHAGNKSPFSLPVSATTVPITTVDIGDNQITTPKLLAEAITADKLAVGSIAVDKIQANAVTTEKITVGGVTTDRLATDAASALQTASLAAVTYSSGNQLLSGSINLLTHTLSPSGSGKLVLFLSSLDTIENIIARAVVTGGEGGVKAELQIRRSSGVVVWQDALKVKTGTITVQLPNVFVFDTPGAGSTVTYQLYYYLYADNAPRTLVMNMFKVNAVLLEAKR